MKTRSRDLARAAEVVSAPVGERPLVRQIAQWQVWPIFLFRAAALQGMNPVIAKGIVDHSTVWVDPTSRWPRTMEYADRLYFGADPAGTAAEIRELHRDIKGIDDAGHAYHAWNREVWAWVHLTALEAMYYAVKVLNPDVPEEEFEAAYQVGRSIGLLYGIRDEDLPTNVGGLRRYVDENLAGNMVITPSTQQLRAFMLAHLTDAISLPDPLNSILAKLAGRPMLTLMFGSFPEYARQMWGVRWSRARELEYRGLLGATRAITRALPDSRSMKPSAYALLAGSPGVPARDSSPAGSLGRGGVRGRRRRCV